MSAADTHFLGVLRHECDMLRGEPLAAQGGEMYPASISPAGFVRDLIGSSASCLLPVMTGTVVGIAVACIAGQAPWGDQSMYLVAAAKALDGLEFGRDIVDVNPPLILWLSEIPVVVARALQVLPQTAMQALLGLLTVVILPWCAALASRDSCPLLRDPFAWLLGALLLYATTIQPWYHLGTREHILVLFLLPYLFLAARRLLGGSVPAGQAFAAGLLALGAVGLKPQHLLVIVAVEGVQFALRRRVDGLGRPEIAGFLFGGVAYLLAIITLAPEYITTVVPLAYGAYLDRDLARWTELIIPARAAKIALAIGLWLLLRRLSERRVLADVLMAAAFASTAAYLVQRKAYEYQLVPALAFFHLSVGCVVAGVVMPRLRGRLVPQGPGLAVAGALLAAATAGFLCYPSQAARAPTYWMDDRKVARAAILPHIPRGTTIFMISPVVGPIHDNVLRYGLEWGSRFTVFWMAEALMTRDLTNPRDARLARWTLDGVVEDLRRYRPSVVLVERCHDHAFKPCEAMGDGRGNFLGWFLNDDRFRVEWTRYIQRRQVGPYDVWCAIDDERACPK